MPKQKPLPAKRERRPTEKAEAQHKLFAKKRNIRIMPLSAKKKKGLLKSLNIDMKPQDYIASPLDKPELVQARAVYLLSDFEGQGLFATQDIPKGTCLGTYTGLEYTLAEYKRHLEQSKSANDHYKMEVGRHIVDAQTQGNFTRLINFSDGQDNVEFIQSRDNMGNIVKVVSKRDIKAGEQLLIDYNQYDPRASAEYLFLNPEDNDQSIQDFINQHQALYALRTVPHQIPSLGLSSGQRLMMTPLIEAILNNKTIQSTMFAQQSTLPAVTVDKQLIPTDNRHQDTMTPLMMAASLGLSRIVLKLIQHGARIDLQQNHSGMNALFFAIKNKKMNVIALLIEQGANIYIHDRQDNIPLHLAIQTLSPDDFQVMVNAIIHTQEDIKNVFLYVNDAECDLVTHCIVNLKFEHLHILLAAYPAYFEDNLRQGTVQERQYNHQILQRALSKVIDLGHQQALLNISNEFAPFLPRAQRVSNQPGAL